MRISRRWGIMSSGFIGLLPCALRGACLCAMEKKSVIKGKTPINSHGQKTFASFCDWLQVSPCLIVCTEEGVRRRRSCVSSPFLQLLDSHMFVILPSRCALLSESFLCSSRSCLDCSLSLSLDISDSGNCRLGVLWFLFITCIAFEGITYLQLHIVSRFPWEAFIYGVLAWRAG